jgi:hypothetical protein
MISRKAANTNIIVFGWIRPDVVSFHFETLNIMKHVLYTMYLEQRKIRLYSVCSREATNTNSILPFWCVFYVRQAIKTAACDLVLHGIVSQSNRPSIINGVRFYDCCSNINCHLSRSKKASNINFTWILTDFP